MIFQVVYWGCCWVWSALSVQLGLQVWRAGHHGGLDSDVVHQLGYHSGWMWPPPVQSVQLGFHSVQASRLGLYLACSGVQLDLCPFAVYLTLWMLISGY
jgi:hypothetical protein